MVRTILILQNQILHATLTSQLVRTAMMLPVTAYKMRGEANSSQSKKFGESRKKKEKRKKEKKGERRKGKGERGKELATALQVERKKEEKGGKRRKEKGERRRDKRRERRKERQEL